MTFRELLEKYKEGLLTEEEKLLVEQELEKNEAINDYLADEMEQTFKQDMEVGSNISDENFKIQKTIKKSVKRTLAIVVAVSVACVFLILFITQYIISPLISSQYYDPTKKTAGQKYQEDLSFDLRAITEVFIPGYAMSFVSNAEDLGYGKYNLIFTRKNIFTKQNETISTKLDKSRVGIENFYTQSYNAFPTFPEFSNEEDSSEYQQSLDFQKEISQTEIEHVRKLPSTSYISAWVRFPKDLALEDLCKIKTKYKNVDFKWIAVRTKEKQGYPLMGFSTGTDDSFISADTVDQEKYPGFQLVDLWHFSGNTPYEVLLAEKYETHFTSLLKYLKDHPEPVTTFIGYSKNYDIERILDYVEKNGANTYGALVYGESEDLLELYESGEIMTFSIENVIPSKYIK